MEKDDHGDVYVGPDGKELTKEEIEKIREKERRLKEGGLGNFAEDEKEDEKDDANIDAEDMWKSMGDGDEEPHEDEKDDDDKVYEEEEIPV